MLFSMFAIAASAATDPAPGYNTPKMTPGTAGTILENANDTAEGVDTNDGSTKGTVIKNLTGHNTHTSYQNNTNSCASCHQTHTAKGDQLLFADGVYQTCTACHDGTLGFLNVFPDGSLDTATSAKTTGAGTFGGSHGSSMHMSNDTVQISAAPGGNPADLTDADTSDDKVRGTMWGESFNCASCHAPHGSYSDRLLQYNPNGIGALPVAEGGNQLVNVPVVDTLEGQTAAVVLLRTEEAAVDGHGKVTIAQYNKSGATYVKTTAPWLYGYDSRTDETKYWTRLMDGAAGISSYNKNVYFDFEHAEVYSVNQTGADKLKLADEGFIARPVVVQMAKEGHDTIQSAYWSGADLSKFDGKTEQELKDLGYSVSTDATSGAKTVKNVGVQMSKFCAACHTDYLVSNSTSGGSHFGDETAAYRHSTNSDSYTCVRCHFGHGTDAYIMKDSLGRTINDLVAIGGQFEGDETGALGYMQDNNASSALKKFTNMSVCWACHNSSHAETIKNAERNADHPVGMPGTN
ncbi:cytochrome c3 family protein [Neobacillus sp. YX16]|uniref:cytochrome c3 family protein n=1 Tax=Neobacillus sp. YX16 TaxID=3047874 RepID=UPI0024C42A66|nr:cytochrome c3 family protein [Neobacillus sp. YX16]WHZ02353.1 cytochrome c3 family protein [Neobacillus sp. YX16]